MSSGDENAQSGKGRAVQQHKRERKELQGSCRVELKKAKDKAAKRDIEARYKLLEEELTARALSEKFETESPFGLRSEESGAPSAASTPLSPTIPEKNGPADATTGRIPPATEGSTGEMEEGSSRKPGKCSGEPEREVTEEEKIARKRAKKERQKGAKEQRQKDQIAEREKEMEGFTPFSVLENDRMEKQLQREGFVIHDIASDGNCLYRAIAHQLCGEGYAGAKDLPYEALRDLTADTLDKHRDEYQHFMPETERDWEGYLAKVRDHLWGGDMELNALSRALRVRIDVYQGDGDAVLTFGDKYHDYQLKISYHKFLYTSAHYNSLVPVEYA